MKAPLVTRFAPSPTGHLHLGHAAAALWAWSAARAGGGRFLLRIEDIDRQRCRASFELDLLEDLAWLGLNWEQPVRRQSEHFATYQQALHRLQALGVVYPCFCSRKDIAAEIAEAGRAPHAVAPSGRVGANDPAGANNQDHGSFTRYPGLCRTLAPARRDALLRAGRPYALRLDVARALARTGPLSWYDQGAGVQGVDSASLGDVVLARRDTPTSYHLSVTVDDALQGVTLVTRGLDLFAATPIHRLLQALLDLPTPTYHHHPLVTDAQGRRLSKRDGAVTLRALRAAGHTPAEIAGLHGQRPIWARIRAN